MHARLQRLFGRLVLLLHPGLAQLLRERPSPALCRHALELGGEDRGETLDAGLKLFGEFRHGQLGTSQVAGPKHNHIRPITEGIMDRAHVIASGPRHQPIRKGESVRVGEQEGSVVAHIAQQNGNDLCGHGRGGSLGSHPLGTNPGGLLEHGHQFVAQLLPARCLWDHHLHRRQRRLSHAGPHSLQVGNVGDLGAAKLEIIDQNARDRLPGRVDVDTRVRCIGRGRNPDVACDKAVLARLQRDLP